jgi:hypothetical protein
MKSLYLGTALAGQPPPQPPTYIPRDPGTFTTTAPRPTHYGDFTAPDPTNVASDPYYQFRLAEGNKAIQRSAAAHGTLLNGGTLKALDSFGSGLASEEGQHAFDRALATYGANRDTNAQNFGQDMASFGGNLNAFGANTAATLGYDRAGMDAAYGNYDRATQAYGAGGGSPYSFGGGSPYDAYAADVAAAGGGGQSGVAELAHLGVGGVKPWLKPRPHYAAGRGY